MYIITWDRAGSLFNVSLHFILIFAKGLNRHDITSIKLIEQMIYDHDIVHTN